MASDPAAAPPPEGGQGWDITPTYLVGIYMAVNAVPDLALLLDGPGCAISKAFYLHGLHDIASTMLDCTGQHRVSHTGVKIHDSIATNFEGQIVSAIRAMAGAPGRSAVLVSSLPLCSIVGMDYARIIREMTPPADIPVLHIPGRSLSRDWLDGYAAAQETLAKEMDLSGGKPKPGNVAIVGHLFSRNEGDGAGNVAELRRMLRALGLNPVTVWLSGEPYKTLRGVRDAGTIISLPHGRKAAGILAKRTGADLIEAEIPFGLEGTRGWLLGLGNALGCRRKAEAFADGELNRLIPRVQWTVQRVFTDLNIAYIGDPLYAAALGGFMGELGARVPWMYLQGDCAHLGNGADKSSPPQLPAEASYHPSITLLLRWWADIRDKADFLIGDGRSLDIIQPTSPWLEWGFPSLFNHVLDDRPFLGFRGAVNFISDLSNACLRVPWASGRPFRF